MSSQLDLVAIEGEVWSLSLPAFVEAARARWPQGLIDAEPQDTIVEPHATFDAVVNGHPRYGLYVEGAQLVLYAGTPEDWADTIVWFLGLLAPSSQVECLTDAAPVPHPLPLDATREQVIEIFNEVDAGC